MNLAHRRVSGTRRNEACTSDVRTCSDVGMPSVPIIEALPRTHVRVTGQVMRMRARPTTGIPALAVTVSDGTGSAIAVWSGRREIGGVTLGRTLVLEGVATLRAGQLEFMNPVYTLVL